MVVLSDILSTAFVVVANLCCGIIKLYHFGSQKTSYTYTRLCRYEQMNYVF